MPSIEEQVSTVAGLLRDIPAAEDLKRLLGSLPCSHTATADWIRHSPNARTESTLAAMDRLLPFIESARGFTPEDVADLGHLDSADPRMTGFADQLRAAWPSSAQVEQITALFDCGLRTLQQMVANEQKMPSQGPPPDGGVGVREGLQKAAADLGLELGDVHTLLGGFQEITAAMRTFEPAAPAVPGRTLEVQPVSAPEINATYKASGELTVEDTTAPVTLPGGDGSGYMQSRLLGEGDPGTPAAGLYGYEYRLDLTGVAGATGGVSAITIPFGDPSTIAYRSAPAASPLYVTTRGAVGSIAPASVRIMSQFVTVTFDPPLPAGASSYFIGFTSSHPQADSRIVVHDGATGQIVTAKAPFPA